MRLDSIQKAKFVMSINLMALFFLVILTPYSINRGNYFFSESTVEAIFLSIEVLAFFLMFRHYDFIIKEKEKENLILNIKLKKRERELLSAFQYLGKLNVQFSMIKSVFEKMKVPNTRNQLKDVYSELLRIVCSATGGDCAGLKIIDLDSSRTLGEFFEFFSENKKEICRPDFGNKYLIEMYNKKIDIDEKNNSQYEFFYSDIKNFSIKAFIYVLKKNENKLNKEERDYLRTIANQCEIFFLLFDVRRYKSIK